MTRVVEGKEFYLDISPEAKQDIREVIMEKVEYTAFGPTTFRENTSDMSNEEISQNISLIPIIENSVFGSENEEKADYGEYFTLDAENSITKNIPIYSRHLLSSKGRRSGFIIDKSIMLFILFKGPIQKISLSVHVEKGNGLKHAKFLPVTTVVSPHDKSYIKIDSVSSFNPELFLIAALKFLEKNGSQYMNPKQIQELLETISTKNNSDDVNSDCDKSHGHTTANDGNDNGNSSGNNVNRNKDKTKHKTNWGSDSESDADKDYVKKRCDHWVKHP